MSAVEEECDECECTYFLLHTKMITARRIQAPTTDPTMNATF